MINIALLGCTGSIGRQVLSVVDRYPEKFKIVSMAAGSNVALFTEQINEMLFSLFLDCKKSLQEITLMLLKHLLFN